MKTRCLNQNDKEFGNYGGRGIEICARWLGMDGFKNFLEDMGERPGPQYMLDRADNDGSYGPENCRWVTSAIQNRNYRRNVFVTIGGERMCLKDACEKLGLNYNIIRERMRRTGASFEEVSKMNGRVERMVVFEGEEMAVAKAARLSGIKSCTIKYRLDRGNPPFGKLRKLRG